MKIGTISLNINAPDFNYGAMLHSWAFQQYLKRLDCVEHTEIIDFTMRTIEGWNRYFPIDKRHIKSVIKSAVSGLAHYGAYMSRVRKFDRFIRDELTVSKEKYIESTIEHADLPYDTLICESDVIWALRRGRFDRPFFLACESMKGKKRIAYSPSMADAAMKPEKEQMLDELLTHPDYISCRESYMKEVLGRHTDKPVEQVLDPVLLLEASDYDRITAPRMLKEKYVVIYMPVNQNNALYQAAKQYAEKNGYKQLEISTKLKHVKSKDYVSVPDAGMEEFLSAIRHSEMVFTNSFHAICFSVLFGKQFYAFTRKLNGKVRDICELFDLQDYYLANDIFEEKAPYDVDRVQERLKELRRHSCRWLQNALEGK